MLLSMFGDLVFTELFLIIPPTTANLKGIHLYFSDASQIVAKTLFSSKH